MKKKVQENETDYFDVLKFKTMAERHKNLFGDVGFKNQFAKFNKEFQEYSESGDIKELADCYISIAGIFNYNQQAATLLLSTLFDFSNISAKKIEQLAFEKCKLTRKKESGMKLMVKLGILISLFMHQSLDSLIFLMENILPENIHHMEIQQKR